MMSMSILEVKRLKKAFGGQRIIDDISFSVEKGEFLSILGLSGCGKTTLLRCLAGLEGIDGGSILINGRDVSGLEAKKRNLGMVFQNYSLFPNMTARQNVLYALKYNKNLQNRPGHREWTDQVMRVCEIYEIYNKYPYQLSGGQQQRTAIARALVMSPDILMLDEPFSALDVSLRQKLKVLLKQCQEQLGITMLYVTHDQEEAFSLSDRIIVLHEGKIQQAGTPAEIYGSPENEFIGLFIQEQLKERYEKLQKIIQPSMAD